MKAGEGRGHSRRHSDTATSNNTTNNNNDTGRRGDEDLLLLSPHKDTIATSGQRRHARHHSDHLIGGKTSTGSVAKAVVTTTSILRPPHRRVPSNGSFSQGKQHSNNSSYHSNGGKYSNYSSLGNSTTTGSYNLSTKKRRDRHDSQSSMSQTSSFGGHRHTRRLDIDDDEDEEEGSRRKQKQEQEQHDNKSSLASHVSWDASTFDTYSRASTGRRTLDSRGGGGSSRGSRSVSFHPSVDHHPDDNRRRRRHDPTTPPPFWIWLTIVLSSILWFLASQGKVRGELHYSLYVGQTWQLPTPHLLANKYHVNAPVSNTSGVEIYQLRWCPPTTNSGGGGGPTTTTTTPRRIQRNSTVTLGGSGGAAQWFQYDYFRLNAGSVLELQATQLQGESSAIYLVRGVNVLDYILKNNGQYPFEYDNMRSLYLDGGGRGSNNNNNNNSSSSISTSIPIRRSDAFILFYAAASHNSGGGGGSTVVGAASKLDVRLTLHSTTHLLPTTGDDETTTTTTTPVCSTADTSTGNCNWASGQEMASLKVSCIIAKVVDLTTKNNDSATTTRTTNNNNNNNNDHDEYDEYDDTFQFEFQSTSLATTNRKVFVTVVGTFTILVAVFLCCRSLQRKEANYDNNDDELLAPLTHHPAIHPRSMLE
jgi:hypothetical protein